MCDDMKIMNVKTWKALAFNSWESQNAQRVVKLNYYSSDSTTQHGFWSFAADHSRLFYLWWFCFSFSVLVCLNHLPHHLFFATLLVLNPVGFQSVNFLTSSIFSILLRYPHHFIHCGCI
jgi:hypothetical protein